MNLPKRDHERGSPVKVNPGRPNRSWTASVRNMPGNSDAMNSSAKDAHPFWLLRDAKSVDQALNPESSN